MVCKKGILRKHVLSCEFCEVANNTFPYRTPPMAASVMRFVVYEAGETLHKYRKWSYFLTRVFLITNSLNVIYLLVKWDCLVLRALLSAFKFLFFKIYVDFIFSHFSERFWSFTCNIWSLQVRNHCYHHYILQYVPLLEKFLIFH